MCGIAGFLTRPPSSPDSAAELTAMVRALAHRGPDGEGTWLDSDAGIALGHRRLAVIDLSPAGNQPMASASGRYEIVFNGEIYNFRDLRAELPGETRFRGHSDTEVILACFERWGVARSVARFNGMFALAVWDRLERKLHLARDPIGEKPLYYSQAGPYFFFGSELKSLRVHPKFPAAIDRAVLPLYIRHGYVPAPYSIYENVYKLPPGTLLTVEGGSFRKTTTRYWSFREVTERAFAKPIADLEDAERQLDALLTDAVRIRMMADVPLGAFLSGGIDSSLVVAKMQSLSARPVRTFTIGFGESEFNEAVAAREVAKYLRTDHTEWYISPNEALGIIPRLPTLYDEPFADSSQIPTFLVSKLARQGVTVVLSGDGGDELFGGYARYERVRRQWRLLSLAPHSARVAAATALRMLNHAGSARLQRVAALLPVREFPAFYDTHSRQWTGDPGLLPDAGELSKPDAYSESSPRFDDLAHVMMAEDTLSYLPDDILVKVDRATMGTSLESRIPLLDSRLVELAWRMPSQWKVQNGESKWILRRMLWRHVPRRLVDRPKRGFAVPISAWIRGPLRDWADGLLNSTRIAREGYLRNELITRRWDAHVSGRADHGMDLWSVLMFQAWLESEKARVASTSTQLAAIA